MKLTHRMEDILSALLELESEQKVVRVKDLEKFFGIKTSSVIDFLRALKKRELINHEKYGYIELTELGVEIAQKVQYKRKILKNFFINVLFLDSSIAQKEACAFEHYIKDETLDYVKLATGFFSEHKENGRYISEIFSEFIKATDNKKEVLKRLNKFSKNEEGIIESIDSDSSKLSVFAKLGFKKGVKIKVKDISPLGDPLLIQINKEEISVSKSDAELICMKKEN